MTECDRSTSAPARTPQLRNTLIVQRRTAFGHQATFDPLT